MIKKFEEFLNEGAIPEPYVKHSPIVLKNVGCSAVYDDEKKTISITIQNKDEFIISCDTFKWREGYPRSIMMAHKRCEDAITQIQSGKIMEGFQSIFKLPYSPYLLELFHSDRPMLDDLRYVTDSAAGIDKERIEQFLAALLEEGEDESTLRKSDPEVYQFFKDALVNLVTYLKCKCEVFFWFYQGLPQLSMNGIW